MIKKKIPDLILLSIVFVLTLLAANYVVSFYLNKHLWKEARINDDFLHFYRKYENELNHLRNVFLVKNKMQKPHNYMFHVIGSGEKQVLINGDSWGEKFYFVNDSYKSFNEHSVLHKNIKFILSGITSYSPTLLSIQARILREDFNFNPEHVFTVIDNTDIGDELCRYRRYRNSVDGKLKVRSFTYNDQMAAYNQHALLRMHEILNSNRISLVKLSQLVYVRLEEKYYAAISENRCGWSKISIPLHNGLSDSEKKYFVDRLLEYIVEIEKFSNVNNLTFLTVPHQNHLKGIYKLSVSELVDVAINNYKGSIKIHHINHEFLYEMYERGELDLEATYQKDDLGSHLSEWGHTTYLLPSVLNNLNYN